jgi:tetratricopeptide (TPR) repeat protein
MICSIPVWAAKEEPAAVPKAAAPAPKAAAPAATPKAAPPAVATAAAHTVKEFKPEMPGVKVDASVLEAISSLAEKDGAVALRLYYLVAEGYQMQNKPDQAIAVYERIAKVFPKQEDDVLNRLISLYQQQGKYDRVIDVAGQLAKLRPDNLYYQQMIANAYLAKGEKDAAITSWNSLVAAHPNNADLRLQFANFLQGQGKADEALKQFEAVVKLKPQDAGSAQQLARAYITNQKLDEAKAVLEKLISTTKDALIQKGVARQLLEIARQQKTLDALLTNAETNVATDPTNLITHWQLIEGYAMSGNNDKILAAVERAAKQFSDDPELCRRLIDAYQMQGKWDKAITIIKEQIVKNPRDFGLKTQLAQAHASAGNTKEAVAVLTQAASAEPDNMMYGEQIAEIYRRVNQFDEAIRQYEALKAKATQDWRKADYDRRIEQIKQQKQAPVAATPTPAKAAEKPAAKKTP